MEITNQIEDQAEDVLWNSFLEDAPDAFALLYTTYVQNLFYYGSSLVTDREVVKDCIQEVFIKIYKNRNALKSVSNVRHYLCTSLRNTLYNYYRSSIDFTELSEIESLFLDSMNCEEKWIEKEADLERKSLIRKLLKMLPPRQQKAIYYRFVEDLSYHEIGEIMDMNFQSAQNLVQRSLRKIRTLFISLSFLFFLF